MSLPSASTRTLATLLVGVATFLSLNAVSSWVDMSGGVTSVAIVLGATAASVIVTRLFSAIRVLPTLVGIVVTIVACVPVFAVTEDGGRQWLPTPSALGQLGDLVRDGIDYAMVTVAPAALSPGLTLIVALTVAGTFLLADLLGVALGFAASAGIVLLAPWLPAVILYRSVAVLPLIVAVGCWVATLGLIRRREGPHDRAPRLATSLVAATAVVLVAAVVSPLLVSGPGWGAFPRFGTSPAGAETTRLSLDLDLRASLGERSTVPVMRYTTDGGRPGAYKLHTVTEFDGVRWNDTPATNLEEQAADAVLWPTPVEDWDEQTLMRIDLDPVGVGEANLPLPTAPRVISADRAWAYDSSLDEAQSATDSLRGDTLVIEAATAFITGEKLLAAEDHIGTDRDDVDDAYLAVPDAMDVDRVREVASTVTAEATSRHAQAVALQQYLRSPMEFTYDTSVQDTTDDAVSTFLDTRAGYCVQFATTMTMMARTLDIPARLAIGYLPGEINSESEYVVTGSDAHAWPELWFPTVGWVRFEPTPAVQTGSAPWYATSAAVDTAAAPTGASQEPVAPEEEELPEEVTPTDEAAPATPQQSSATTEGPLWWLIAVAAALLLAAGAWAWLRQRGRGTTVASAVDGVWERLWHDLPESAQWPASFTPSEAVTFVASARDAEGQSLSPDALSALTRLAGAVTAHRYDPAGTDISHEQLHAWRRQVLADVERTSSRS